jgi:UDP-N-acetylglucosamine 1-carboxyvinyltransferase
MNIIEITGGAELRGCVTVSGSKNAVLPLLASTLLTEEECVISEVPDLKDVDCMAELLESFGAKVVFDKKSNTITVNCSKISSNEAPEELVSKMRASIVTMGPLLARTGGATFPLPGGCAIGDRPIDLHIKGLSMLGADIEMSEDETHRGFVKASAGNLTGNEIYLDTPSVGATQNIMMAAALAGGTTIIENAAQEPEVVDLANYLNKMGAKIRGAGTDVIKIEGVESLHGANHSVIPDRIEASTFMLAAAITRSEITIKSMLVSHVIPIVAKLRECGAEVEETRTGVHVSAHGAQLVATDIKTLPYPGFPTDAQPQFMSLLSTVSGSSIILETVFENRFMHIAQLNKMGAGIIEKGRRAIVPGGKILQGAEVSATDLRAGAALIIAGLAAKGTTRISNIYHIDRGYDAITEKLNTLGAKIKRV